MNSSASRLLVLVEDTAATRDLWPLWRQKALEPVLQRVEKSDLGAYELNLVAFASVDSQSDALLRSGTWTGDVQRFRRYCDSLTFEGSAHENALGDALTEAVYCMQQPSALGPLHEVRQHVLLCWTGSVGFRPVLWPVVDSPLKADDAQVLAPRLMLSKLVSTLKMSVSVVTGQITPQEQQLVQQFEMWTERKITKKRLELAQDRACLMLIHPKWRHGLQALFPESSNVEERMEMGTAAFPVAAVESSDACTNAPGSPMNGDWHFRRRQQQLHEPRAQQMQELGVSPRSLSHKMEDDQPCCTMPMTCVTQNPSKHNTPTAPSPKDHTFSDAVDISSWQKNCATTKRPWKDEGECFDRGCSPEEQFALERDLMVFEETTQCGSNGGGVGAERDTCSEKESRLDSATSYGGGSSSPAHSSTTKQNKPSAQETAIELVRPLTTVSPLQLAVTEAGTSSTHHQAASPSTIAAVMQRSTTFSPSPSHSIENHEGGAQRKLELIQKRIGYDTSAIRSGQQERELHQQRTVHVMTPRHAGASEQQCSPRMMKSFSKASETQQQHEIRTPFQGPEVPDAKRPRTKYVSSTKPIIKANSGPFSLNEQSVLSSAAIHPSRRHSREIEASRQRHPMTSEPYPRPLGLAMGFGWNVEWSGPLFLAGPIVRQSAPQKLFDMEILCKRTLSMAGAWPNELVVHTMERKEHQHCPFPCMINLRWESLTELGRTFGKWLTENKMIAIVDLPGEKSSRLIISVQDSSSYCGPGQLVAGFQRDCTTI